VQEAGVFESGLGDAPRDASCAYIVEEGNRTPLSLYVMFDKSSSMQGTKWEGGKAGLQVFLEDPASAGIRVAFNLFPRTPDSVPACDQNAYKEPRVPYDVLPPNAQPIVDLLDGELPDGFGTPIYPALGGALLKALAEAKAGESAAVLLVTDGEPQGPASTCAGLDPEDTQVIAGIAAQAASMNPPVFTYVIGLPGANQAFASAVAAAGKGTAILVGSGDVGKEFQAALAAVLGTALPCEFFIPDKVAQGEIDPNNVNVIYTPGGGGSFETLPRSDDCDPPGWTYDDPQQPDRIVLCPQTCASIKADLEGKMEIMLGCATVVK
jgi:hypothetical protein